MKETVAARKHLVALLMIVPAAILGCDSGPSAGPFGPPDHSPLLKPYAGHWVFNLAKTLAAEKAAGASDEEIAKSQELPGAFPHSEDVYPDLTITGNVAVGSDITNSEYRFFAMHRHGDTLCGKAWHHEDRFDPGDMTKCHVRLKIEHGDLYLEVNMHEELPDDDPDLAPKNRVESDSSECEAKKQKLKDWQTLVYSRGS